MFAELFECLDATDEPCPASEAEFDNRQNVITFVPERESLFWRRLALAGWALATLLAAILAMKAHIV